MNADDLVHILRDPRPEEPDTKRWRAALLLVHRLIPEPEKAIELGSSIWTMRCMGTSLRPDRGGLKFVRLPNGQWVDDAEFDTFKFHAFGCYREEIVKLLNQVEQIVDKQEVPEAWRSYAS